MITIKKGLDIPIKGIPKQIIDRTQYTRHAALLGTDYLDIRPKFQVEIGAQVAKGSPLFVDKKRPEICFTSPISGVVKDIIRGERRAFLGIIIEAQGDHEVQFEPINPIEATKEQIIERLLESGSWTALRTRPFSKIPSPDSSCVAIFINAMDTQPLAADPGVILKDQETYFKLGVTALSKLAPKVFISSKPETSIPQIDIPTVELAQFTGPHPAGLVGTHIHFLQPVSLERTVWHIDVQDVIAIGHLFQTGQIQTDRIISLAGPSVKEPRLVKTHLGADIVELCNNQLKENEEHRIISGSVLHGQKAEDTLPFLHRYHKQVSVIPEDRKQRFMGWLSPKSKTHSITRTTIGALKRGPLDFTTSTNGSPRAMVPLGNFEMVMPLDILATPLLRDLLTYDTDEAQELGCLELDEEDLALCTYVCQGKYDYGRYLRECLAIIEKEG